MQARSGETAPVLLVDAGNTRLKWARLADDSAAPATSPVRRSRAHGSLGPVNAHAHRGVDAAGWQRAIASGTRPARVLVSNVAGEAFGSELARWCEATWSVTPEFAATRSRAAGLTIAYAEPQALGVDRWLAMIAARRAAEGAFVVVGAGTALTVDAVARDGRHLGGWIVPGLALMREALYERTAGIARAAALAASATHGAFGVNTAGAVEHGALLALAALADRAVDELADRAAGESAAERAGDAAEPRCLLTGGDAESVARWCRRAHALAPDLVLEGLAVLAGETGAC